MDIEAGLFVLSVCVEDIFIEDVHPKCLVKVRSIRRSEEVSHNRIEFDPAGSG